MGSKIKMTKLMRFDELIKYIFDECIKDKHFYLKDSTYDYVYVDKNNEITFEGYTEIDANQRYVVWVEKEVPDDFNFYELAVLCISGLRLEKSTNVNDILEKYHDVLEIHARFDNRLQKVWDNWEVDQ